MFIPELSGIVMLPHFIEIWFNIYKGIAVVFVKFLNSWAKNKSKALKQIGAPAFSSSSRKTRVQSTVNSTSCAWRDVPFFTWITARRKAAGRYLGNHSFGPFL